jgi:hypothetical protein
MARLYQTLGKFHIIDLSSPKRTSRVDTQQACSPKRFWETLTVPNLRRELRKEDAPDGKQVLLGSGNQREKKGECRG